MSDTTELSPSRMLEPLTAHQQWLEDRREVEYRTLARFPGYRYGSDGSVWTELQRRGGYKYVQTGMWRKLRPRLTKKGYLRVRLYTGPDGPKYIEVHRLICESFHGPCPPGLVARHYPDRTPTNCASDNLVWGTTQENSRDKLEHGTQPCGEALPQSKLTESSVRDIREMLRRGGKLADIANQFGVCFQLISLIKHGKIWRHVV